jgi:ATP sulfurylase
LEGQNFPECKKCEMRQKKEKCGPKNWKIFWVNSSKIERNLKFEYQWKKIQYPEVSDILFLGKNKFSFGENSFSVRISTLHKKNQNPV